MSRFVCRHCGRGFMSADGLKSHIKSSHDVFEEAYICRSWDGFVRVKWWAKKPAHTYRIGQSVKLNTIGL